MHRRGHCYVLKKRGLAAPKPLNSQEFLREGENASNLVAEPWFRFPSTIVIAMKDGQQLRPTHHEWHILQVDWRLLLVTSRRCSARINLSPGIMRAAATWKGAYHDTESRSDQ
jgi:hypothetical protein